MSVAWSNLSVVSPSLSDFAPVFAYAPPDFAPAASLADELSAFPCEADEDRSVDDPRSLDIPRSFDDPRSLDIPRSFDDPRSLDDSRSIDGARSVVEAERSDIGAPSFLPEVADAVVHSFIACAPGRST